MTDPELLDMQRKLNDLHNARLDGLSFSGRRKIRWYERLYLWIVEHLA